MGDKWETSVNSCGPRHPKWETSVGDKGETSVNPCGPRNPEWETSVGDKCGRLSAAQGTQSGRQGGDKCKLMRPKAAQSGTQVWETGVGDEKCKLMRPKEPRVGDKCGPWNQVWETSVGDKCGRQV